MSPTAPTFDLASLHEARVLGQHHAEHDGRRNSLDVRFAHGIVRDRVGARLRPCVRSHEVGRERFAVRLELRRRHACCATRLVSAGVGPTTRARDGRRLLRRARDDASADSCRSAESVGPQTRSAAMAITAATAIATSRPAMPSHLTHTTSLAARDDSASRRRADPTCVVDPIPEGQLAWSSTTQ